MQLVRRAELSAVATVHLDTPVRDVLRAHPTTLSVFERHRLDYCCGGGRALRDACAKAAVDEQLVLRELDDAIAGPRSPYSELPPEELDVGALLSHVLGTHHVVTRQAAATLPALARKVASVHGSKDASLIALSAEVTRLFEDLEHHMQCEEQVLFPYLVSLVESARRGERHARPPFGKAENPIRAMRAEHDAAGEVLAEIARLTHGYVVPPGACGSWTALIQGLEAHTKDLMRHVWTENEVLFPKAIALEARVRG